MCSTGPESSLSREDLRSPFTRFGGAELIGIEVEVAALDPETGQSISYHGNSGIEALLYRLLDEFGSDAPSYENGNLIGFALPRGGTVSLEHGGAVEYSAPPAQSVVDAVGATRSTLRQLAETARELNIAIVPGANYPFTRAEQVQWVPHSRIPIMWRHFASVGDLGKHGVDVMSRALSVQATFDYTSETDMIEKIRMQAMASTPASALFVNSPLEDGGLTGGMSQRMKYWARVDPNRSRINPLMLSSDFTTDRFIDWALDLPMIYRNLPDGSKGAASARPFRSLLETGFGDGSVPKARDWSAHLSQIYLDVRLRETLEVRAVDGPPFSALQTVPAFWTGLTYHRPSRLAAIELLQDVKYEQHLEALDGIAGAGLGCELAGRPVQEYAFELLRLADIGLRALAGEGREDHRVVSYLDPLHEIAASGRTFAQICAARWQGDFDGSAKRFVEAYRI